MASSNAGATDTDILIVGGGLSGLSLANALRRQQEAGADVRFHLVEGRDVLGGRVQSLPEVDASPLGDGVDAYDMGPAWFWPGQARMEALLKDLGLERFNQYAEGAIVVQGPSGGVQVYDQGMGSMAGSYRVVGGLGRVTQRLAERLPPASLSLGTTLKSVSMGEGDAAVQGEVLGPGGVRSVIVAKAVVIAAPPQLVEATVTFEPKLPAAAISRMKQIPTWMAGHAKVVAIYDTPFWRAAGLAGDGMSHAGPLGEIHDASPASGTAGALFGFVRTPASERQQPGFDLAAASVRQLEAMFGPEAGRPRKVLVKDWAADPSTATPGKGVQVSRGHHPYFAPKELQGIWGGRLLFASTEVAPEDGGFLEGALAAAESAHGALRKAGIAPL
eukprot:jgi/Tetstr1/466511/TSEL_011018.t1